MKVHCANKRKMSYVFYPQK